MAILLRKNKLQVWVAHPTTEGKGKEGELYIDDQQHYALTVMFEETLERQEEEKTARQEFYDSHDENGDDIDDGWPHYPNDDKEEN